MAKYPTPFIHPVEAMCLAGIGPKIVSQLETKLAEHCVANGLPMPSKYLRYRHNYIFFTVSKERASCA